MNINDVILYGLICAINAEIEGMKILNKERLLNNQYVAYDESHFYNMAEQIKELIKKYRR